MLIAVLQFSRYKIKYMCNLLLCDNESKRDYVLKQ